MVTTARETNVSRTRNHAEEERRRRSSERSSPHFNDESRLKNKSLSPKRSSTKPSRLVGQTSTPRRTAPPTASHERAVRLQVLHHHALALHLRVHVRQTPRSGIARFPPHRVPRRFLESRARGRAFIPLGRRRVSVHGRADVVFVSVEPRCGRVRGVWIHSLILSKSRRRRRRRERRNDHVERESGARATVEISQRDVEKW